MWENAAFTFFMKAQVARKGVILHNSFFMSYAWASIGNKWQCSACLKSERVLIYSELKSVKLLLALSILRKQTFKKIVTVQLMINDILIKHSQTVVPM